MSEWIPANPSVNSRGMHGVRMANDFSSVRDRLVPFAEEPAPLEDEQVVVAPVQRRRFVQPAPVVVDTEMRRSHK